LTVKDNQFFKLNKYTSDFGADSDKKLSKTHRLCEEIKKHKQDLSGFKGLSDFMGDLKMKFKFPGVEIKTDLKTKILDEISSSIIASFLYPGDVKVFVRGFADSCSNNKTSCKIGSLDNSYGGKYLYNTVNIHPFVESDETKNYEQKSMNPESTGWQSREVDAGKVYDNQQLPNLRAKIFTKEFLEPVVTTCKYSDKAKNVGILQGRPDPEIDESKRKVEIYLAIYPKEK
jgi:hypothetical protein